jgi:hypothetical protein
MAGLLLGVASVVPVAASFLPVANPGFEAESVANGFVVLGAPVGWTPYQPGELDGVSDVVGLLNPTGTLHFPGGAAEGRNVAVVFLGGAATGEAGLQQTLSATLEAGNRYDLEVEVGNIASGTANFGFFNLDGFPGYRVDLMAGSTVLASDANSLVGSLAEGTFARSTVSFVVPAAHPALGSPLGIRLVNLNQPGTGSAPGIEVNFDGVSLEVTPVPETGFFGGLAWVVGLGLGWKLAHRRA